MILKVHKTKPDVWFIDAAYAVHVDCMSHMDGAYTMGIGSFFSVSCKQKIKSKSFMEDDLNVVDDFIGHVLGTRHFLQAQDYKAAEKVIILQDNKSAILFQIQNVN